MIDMNLKSVFENPTFKKVLKKTGVVAGAIVIEGIKGVAIKTATNTITTALDSGMEGVKKLTIEDYVGRGKKKKKIDVDIPNVKSNKEKAKVEVDADWRPIDVEVDQEND
jgi:hypothetical protein